MNSFNLLGILSIVTAVSLFVGMVVPTAIAQDNMSMGMNNSTGMMMDN